MSRAASAQSTPPALAAYLRRATWGLPPQRQQELWDELEDHVLTRADGLCLSGLSPSEALSQALRELGPPTRVSAGMTQVYLMPKLILAASAAALALSAALYALAGGGGTLLTLPALDRQPAKPSCVRGTVPSQEHVTIVSQKGGVTCYTSKNSWVYAGAYIGLDDLQKALEARGLTASFQPSGALDIRFPGGTRHVLFPRFQQTGQGYVDASYLIMKTIGEPVRLTGYDNPRLALGDLRLQLGSQAQPVSGVDFYGGLVPPLIGALTSPKLEEGWSASFATINRRASSNITLPRHSIQTKLKPGEVVMLLTKQDRQRHFADVAPVNSDGTVALYNDQARLRFVSNVDQLSPDPSGGRIPALLVRVTNVPLNNLKSGIFLPSQPTSDAAN